GGQKQRLCIARTLLKHPRVLIFDDSTSAVDMATDAKIREHIAQIPDTTVIIIAQRIASVMDADRIVVLDDGRIHGVGTHEELLAGDNIYQEIYASQMEFAGDASDDGDADDANDPFSSVAYGSSLEGGERHA
ncbi:MAG TPA: ABC transporter, partial [Collinsella sp.]|nr:ABC transporter [Collinsella sp.]